MPTRKPFSIKDLDSSLIEWPELLTPNANAETTQTPDQELETSAWLDLPIPQTFEPAFALKPIAIEANPVPAPIIEVHKRPCFHLVFASACAIQNSVFAQMQSIRDTVAQRNAGKNIHAVLLYQSGWFMQWLEGPKESIENLYAEISKDPRHRDISILHNETGYRLLQKPWSMAMLQSSDTYQDFTQRINALRASKHTLPVCSPIDILRILTTPFKKIESPNIGNSLSMLRIAMCSSNRHEAFDVVAWLSDYFSSEQIRCRIAGMAHMDVATDYVDLPIKKQNIRITAIARNGISIGLVNALLGSYAYFVLLLNPAGMRNKQLMELVCKACADQPKTPILIGVGAHPDSHAELEAIAEKANIAYIRTPNMHCSDPAQIWRIIQTAARQFQN